MKWKKYTIETVSYTHLDVYKRQSYDCVISHDNYWLGFPHLYYPSNPHFAEISVLSSTGEIVQIKNYVSAMENNLVESRRLVDSGNTALDTVLNLSLIHIFHTV